MQRNRGFTLIELSIVLVIIGLLVSGVLVGRDLIKAAEIRATVGQIEKYNAVANTFRVKYNGLPGDMNASAFGFAATNVNTISPYGVTIGRGDSNGLIESFYAAGGYPGYVGQGEPYLFWTHLSQANLIPAVPNPETSYASGSYLDAETNPAAKIGESNVIAVGSLNGINYFGIMLDFRLISATITPVEAYQFDTKMDDGSPDTGTVISATSAFGGWPRVGTLGGDAADNSACYNTTTHAYAIAVAQTGQCGLSIRASF